MSHRFSEAQSLYSAPWGSSRTGLVQGIELCFVIAQASNRIMVLTSGGCVGWAYANMFEEVDCG